MTQEQITQGNKLIAEFMGLKQQTRFNSLLGSNETVWVKSESELDEWNYLSDYSTSWNHLMPTLLKAKGTKGSDEWNGWNTLNISLMACDIKGVFLQLTWFIKWFNTQSK